MRSTIAARCIGLAGKEPDALPSVQISDCGNLGTWDSCATLEHNQVVQSELEPFMCIDQPAIVFESIDLAAIGAASQSSSGQRKFEFQLADAEKLMFPDGHFDRSVHTCLLHHLGDPESALREMKRVVRPGGIVSIYLPNDPGFIYRLVQQATTGRLQRRVLKSQEYSISEGYLRALEHPNHYLAINEMILEVFKSDEIKRTNFPFRVSAFNFNFFSVFHITISA
jgi:phosphatidylethanolamine/phosphatidyl-N-methylethanolamine N-methyltransferase